MSTLTREQIVKRIAQEIKDGYTVNLGIGMPTLVANYIPSNIDVVLQSENRWTMAAQSFVWLRFSQSKNNIIDMVSLSYNYLLIHVIIYVLLIFLIIFLYLKNYPLIYFQCHVMLFYHQLI